MPDYRIYEVGERGYVSLITSIYASKASDALESRGINGKRKSLIKEGYLYIVLPVEGVNPYSGPSIFRWEAPFKPPAPEAVPFDINNAR